MEEIKTLTVGATSEASMTVQESDTAHALALSPEDDFPKVFATTRMIGLMEIAASRMMLPLLKEGQLSVGVVVNVRHTAATPVGSVARAVATYLGPEGKLFRFRVEAFDEGGLIGEGEHTRAIISTARLLEGAAKRRG